MRLVVHLGRAALIFWVGAVLLPTAVVEATSPRPAAPAEAALLGVATSSTSGRDHLSGMTAQVQEAESDVRDLVARVRLEAERFIVRIP